VLLVLPSDHIFANVPAFHHAVRVGLKAAEGGALVTFGIVPTHPETGYGYVKASQTLDPNAAVPVQQFVEKPDLATAQAYLKDGSYTWNSGMFMFRVSVFLQELGKINPTMLQACQGAWAKAQKDLEFVRLDKDSFASSPSDSVDYAVMEKTSKAVVVPLDAGWNDVGAWSAVWQVLPQDAQGNAIRGDVLLENAKNSYVHADSRLVALIGVEDLVVVETSDAVLVAHKDKAQDVKKVVDRLKEQKRPEVDLHREVFRPWGSYDSVDNGERFQVKRITVKPGAKLSLQMHHHRAEHWVVVQGTATVRLGDEVRLVTENESVYIPVGMTHSLENPGKVPLHLIEVQSGTYLGEDDIVRFEDLYGRR
jgi:mannose-1-phosphate guanylyltransferase/mannose-6-phosphate isomerase